MDNNSGGSGEIGGEQSSQVSAMLSSPSAGGMRLARGSPGVRRAVSKPIRIIRSTSVPGQLQDKSQTSPAAPGMGGSSGGNTRRAFHAHTDRGLQYELGLGAAGGGGYGGIAQSLPIPQAPLLAGSLPPPSRFDDLPPLSLGPQAKNESFSADCGSLSASFKASNIVKFATSCPANLGGNFGRPPGPKHNPSMSVLAEGELDEGEETGTDSDVPSPGPKSMTALSLLESLAKKNEMTTSPDKGAPDCDNDNESVESSGDSSERLPIQDDVFELEELDEVSGNIEALSLGEAEN